MTKLKVRQHLWMRGGSVGIAFNIEEDVNVEIMSTRKDGSRNFPGEYFISWDQLKEYPITNFRKGVPVRVVPINNLEKIK